MSTERKDKDTVPAEVEDLPTQPATEDADEVKGGTTRRGYNYYGGLGGRSCAPPSWDVPF
jgi:hypothetical protein